MVSSSRRVEGDFAVRSEFFSSRKEKRRIWQNNIIANDFSTFICATVSFFYTT